MKVVHVPVKKYGGSRGIAPPFLISALGGGEWSASHLGRFTPWKITSVIYWIGGWVGPRAVMNPGEGKKSLASAGIRTPAVKPVTRCYTDWHIQLIGYLYA
jgi:hypothetical protein